MSDNESQSLSRESQRHTRRQQSQSPDSNQELMEDKRMKQRKFQKNQGSLIGKVQKKVQQQNTQIKNKRKPQVKIDDMEVKTNKKVNVGQLQQQQNVAGVFLYVPGERYPDLSDFLQQTIEIKVASEYISKYNKFLIQRSIWGTDSYTSESDAVCMLVHSGFINSNFQDDKIYNMQGVSLYCKVTKSKKTYGSALKNGLLSRSYKNHQGFSLKPENWGWIEELGRLEDLISYAKTMATWDKSKRSKEVVQKPPSRYLQTIPELNIVFNMNNEPAYKYSCINFCDKGNDIKTWKSYKLKSQVLYLDTSDNKRYEISRIENQQKMEEEEDDQYLFKEFDQYKFVEVLEPFEKDNNFMEEQQRPLSENYVKIIFDEIDWSDILWGSQTIQAKDVQINRIKNYKFYDRRV